MVYWQNTDAYQFIKSQGSDTYVADQNRIANPNGSHNAVGLILSQSVTSIFSGVVNLVESHQAKSGSDSNYSVKGETNWLNKYNRANKKYEKALARYNDTKLPQQKRDKAKSYAQRYLNAMQGYSVKSRSLANAYSIAAAKMPKS